LALYILPLVIGLLVILVGQLGEPDSDQINLSAMCLGFFAFAVSVCCSLTISGERILFYQVK